MGTVQLGGVLETGYVAAEYPDVTNLDLEDVTRIETQACRGLYHLKEVYINPECDDIESAAFEDCPNLETINIPEALDHVPVRFLATCNFLQSIFIPDKVKDIAFCSFYRCFSLKVVTGAQNVVNIGDWAFVETAINWFNFEKVQHIGALAFQLSKLKSVRFGHHLKLVDQRAFAHISTLDYVYYECHTSPEICSSAFMGSFPTVHFENDHKRVPYTIKMLFAPWCRQLTRRVPVFEEDGPFFLYIKANERVPENLDKYLTELLHAQHSDTDDKVVKGCDIF